MDCLANPPCGPRELRGALQYRAWYKNILGLLTLSMLAHCGDPALPGGDTAINTFDYRKLPRIVSTVELLQRSARFDVEGETVVIADRYRGFSILDISDPRFPKSTFEVDWAEIVVDVCRRSSWLYVLDRASLHVLDIAAPNTPPLGSLPFPEGARATQMFMDNICIVALEAGKDHLLWFIDVGDPEQLRKISEVPIGGTIVDMTVDGNLLLVGTENGIVFLDIADTKHVETLSSMGHGRYVAAGNGFAYITRGNYSGLLVLNILDPRNPIQIASTLTPNGFGPMILRGNQLFIRIRDRVEVINVLDRRQPRAEGSIFAPGIGSMQLHGSRLWTSGANLLEEHDLGEALRVPLLGERGIRYWWAWAQLKGGSFYGRNFRGPFVLSILDPQLPSPPRTLPGHSGSWISHVDGQTAYFRDREHVYIRHLETGELLSTVPFEDEIRWLTVAGDYLYVVLVDRLDSRYDLQTVDISNVRAPRFAGRIRREGTPHVRIRDFQLDGSYLYVLSDEKLDVIDVSRPHNVKLVAQLPIERAIGLTVHGDFLYVLSRYSYDGSTPLITISIRQPAQPRVVSSVEVEGRLSQLVADGNFLYAISSAGLRVFDISHRASPKHVALQAWISTNSARKIVIGNGVLYALMSEGLHVLPLHAPER